MICRQVELIDPESEARLTCWLTLEDLDRFKSQPGAKITLKTTGERIWTVMVIYRTGLEQEALHKPWKVGGLGASGG